MAQQVNITVTIGGETISPVADIDISQGLFDHNVIQVVLPLDAFNENNTQILNQAKDFLNQPLTAEISPGLFDQLQRDFTFNGVVTDIRVARYQRGAKMIFVTAYSPTIHLSGVPTTRSFHEMSLADIVNQVLQDAPANMTAQVNPRFSETLEYVVQCQETNMQFLQRLADTYGEWIYYDGDEFVFGQLPSSTPIDLPLEKDLLEMKLSMRVVPVNFKAEAYDYMNPGLYESTAKPDEITDIDSFGKEILSKHEPKVFTSSSDRGASLHLPHRSFSSQQALDDYVLHEMATRSRSMVVLNGTSDHIKLRVGAVINITGEKSNEVDLDKYIITSISHSIDQNFSYTNTFQAIPAAATSPPGNPRARMPVCENEIGLVFENDDPEGLGRVKVKFNWQRGLDATPWIRVLRPMAGQADDLHGFFFTPEIGDEVIVGFLNNNPDSPYVMGSVYFNHESNHPSRWHDANINRKVIKTRSGNQVHFIDEEGKEEIIITNNDIDSATNEIRLSMEGNGQITIMTMGKLDIRADSISMEANQGITIKAGTNLVIESGSNTEMNAQEMKVDATTVSVKGAAKVEMEGAMTSVKASGQLELDSGGIASLKGALVKIN